MPTISGIYRLMLPIGLAAMVSCAAETTPVSILEPEPGSVHAPGDTVEVRFSSRAQPKTALILFGAQSVLLEDGSSTASFLVPESDGSLPIAVLVVDAAGEEHSAEMEIRVQPREKHINILPVQDEVVLIEGDRIAPSALAEYEDGSTRPLDASRLTLVSKHPSIASTDGGEIVAVAVGHALVEVRSGGAQGLILVEVVPCPEVAPPRVVAEGSLCENGTVTLTAWAGQDFRWSTGQTTESIGVTEPGTYTVEATIVGNCRATSAPILVEAASRCSDEDSIPPDRD